MSYFQGLTERCNRVRDTTADVNVDRSGPRDYKNGFCFEDIQRIKRSGMEKSQNGGTRDEAEDC